MKTKVFLSGELTLSPTAEQSASTLHAGRLQDNPIPSSTLSIGTLLEQRYRISELIGSGGMSRVYRAEHVLLGRLVAIKTLRSSLSEDDASIARVLREARVTAAVDSPYVVKILDIGRLPGAGYYLVLEHLNGCDLAALIKRRGTLDVAHSLDIAMQLCDAVSAVHQLGVVHRDIKPHNIFATSMTPLNIKLLDFGICKAARELDRLSITDTGAGVMLGTPNYMAPEQIHQLEPTDPRTDIYAIGATLHFMLTGRPPFEGTSLPRLLLQICETPLTPLKQLPDVTRVLERALAKEPQDRFPSAGDLRKALAACAKQRRMREQQRAHA